MNRWRWRHGFGRVAVVTHGAAVWALLAGALVTQAACRRTHLLPRADGAAVVLAPAGATKDQDVTFAPEVEPNDTLAAAHKLDFGVGAAALGIAGRVGAGSGKTRDADLFRVVVPAATGATGGDTGGSAAAAPALRRRLAVEVTPDASLAVTVDALDDQGQALISAGGGAAGEVDGFPNLAVSPGVYFLRVRAAGTGEGGYRMTARLNAPENGEELEPNGKGALASEASADGEVIGYHGWRRDQDWYRVPLAGVAEGSVLAVDLEPVPGVAASLLIYDAAERKLIESRGRTDERVAIRNVRLPAGEPHLFVVVRTDSGYNAGARYNLRLRTAAPRAGGELEPNDDAAHAQTVGEGDTLGYLARGDADVFRFVVAAATELDIQVAPPERVDVKLEVIREPDGLLLVRADSGKRHEPERIPNLFASGGSLLIKLSAGKGDGNPDEPYHLTISGHPPDPGAEKEPNGAAASATLLPVGQPGTGLTFPRGDVDFWRAAAAPGADGNVAVTVTGVAGGTIEVRVLAPDERELGRFKVDGAGPGSASVVTGEAACCLIQVRDVAGKSAPPNPRDRYTLTVGR